jgi:hypothetical protein
LPALKNKFPTKEAAKRGGLFFDLRIFLEPVAERCASGIQRFSKEMTNSSMMEFVEIMDTAIYNLLAPDYYWNEDGKWAKKNAFVLIPTGDGYGIAFNTSIPEREILKITRNIYLALAKNKSFKFRMGLAKASSIVTLDLNRNVNVFGVGIVLATRVCNAAQTGQILVHEGFAKLLLYSSEVKEFRKLPTLLAKHGLPLECYNYAGVHGRQRFGRKRVVSTRKPAANARLGSPPRSLRRETNIIGIGETALALMKLRTC